MHVLYYIVFKVHEIFRKWRSNVTDKKLDEVSSVLIDMIIDWYLTIIDFTHSFFKSSVTFSIIDGIF